MASFRNRSRYFVSVKNRDDLYKQYPHSCARQAQAYLQELRRQGFKPTLGQLEDCIEVRIRRRGYPDLFFTRCSWVQAERDAMQIEEQRSRGFFVDYTKSHKVTLAELIRRYIREECPKHKGAESEVYRLNALLADSGVEAEPGPKARQEPMSAALEAGHPAPSNARAKKSGRHRQKRLAITNVEFLHKPFALVEPTDIEAYIRDRLESVAPSTVDRELDLLAAVVNVAINTWRFPIHLSPMAGVRRPSYFNERDRRLQPGEEERLLAAAREEDRARTIESEVARLLEPARAPVKNLAVSAKKQFLAEKRRQAVAEATRSCRHVPLFETLFSFLLHTGARRSEALTLTWKNTDLQGQTAFFPKTKNGRSRTVPLSGAIVAPLGELLREGETVFPVSIDILKGVWSRICERAEVHDLHIHDLRHEALSRLADTGLFSLVDLQSISGHRDVRMLLRYSHLCARRLAHRIDEAMKQGHLYSHKGRRRLEQNSGVTMAELVQDTMADAMAAGHAQRTLAARDAGTELLQPGSELSSEALPKNVIVFASRRR